MRKLELLGQCLPFLAHASGQTMAQVHAMPVDKAFFACGEHGVKLVTRAAELTASGKSLEQELCVAEILALQPLAELFKPAMASVKIS